MNSIPHPKQTTVPQRPLIPVDAISSPDEAEGDQVRGFFYDARRALTAGDYLLRKWLPILRPDLFTLIKVLRSMCYFNRETGELREELGASNLAGGTQTILEALVEAGAPLECMTDLAALGLTRLRQQLELGNPIENQAGYYIAIMRDLALEAMVKRWDTVELE